MAKLSSEEVLYFLRIAGGNTSRALCARFGVSQPTMSRILSRLSGAIIRVGRGARSRYFSLREKAPIPIFRVDEAGFTNQTGRLFVLDSGFYFETDAEMPALFGQEFSDGFFESLPWFLYEMRPQGYLGRAIAQRLHAEENFPRNPQDWTDTQILHYLKSRGGDEPGALIVGERSLERFLSAETERIPENSREREYPKLAEQTLGKERPGSSAAGEQPKFLTAITSADGNAKHVLVKFSGNRDLPAEARRADLLIAEYWAGEILREEGFPVPENALFFFENRCFLESARIDRIGACGRRWTCSLAAIEPALIGSGADSWGGAVRRGTALGLFSEETLEKVVALEKFGNAIGNNDMHWGNLSFVVGSKFPFEPAPIYDMTPMIYRVREDSSFPRCPFPLKAPDASSARIAQKFWTKIAADVRVSGTFRKIAQAHAA